MGGRSPGWGIRVFPDGPAGRAPTRCPGHFVIVSLPPPRPSAARAGREGTHCYSCRFQGSGNTRANPAKAYIPEKDKHGQTKPKPAPRRFQKDPEHRAACVGPSWANLGGHVGRKERTDPCCAQWGWGRGRRHRWAQADARTGGQLPAGPASGGPYLGGNEMSSSYSLSL